MKKPSRSFQALVPIALVLLVLACCAGFVPRTDADEIVNSAGMRLRLIEAGRFERGERELSSGFHEDHAEFNTAEDDRPVHPVVVTKPFYLAATEVTVGQFRRFVEETGYRTSAENNPRGAVGWDPAPPPDNPRFLSTFRDGGGFRWTRPGFEQADDHPVIGVSFADAQAFCRWLSDKEGARYRLPTEAEWEYAARAGTATYFSFGNEYRGRIHRFANIGNVELERAFPDRVRRQWLLDVERDPADPHVFTAPVGSYEPNPWGLFDMYGNVWEWCEDRYLDTAYTPYSRAGYQQVRRRAMDPVNLEKWSDAGDWRVIRGGSWFNAPIQCRSAVRGYFEANDAACYVGFRVARDAPDELVARARAKFERSEAARRRIEQLVPRLQERRDGRLTLVLRRDEVTDDFFAALEQLDEPVDIHIYGQRRLTAEDVARLARTPQLAGLMLSDAGAGVTDADFKMLADHPELELLQITGAPNLSGGVLLYLRGHERLELLHLDAARITDEALEALPQLDRLRILHLAGTGSQGLVLDRCQRSPLQDFSCSSLSDDGARLLASFPSLRSVVAAGSPLSRAGLAELAGLPQLQHLDLTGCRGLADEDLALIGDAGVLRILRLRDTAAGDAALAGIVRLNHLDELQIGSEHLSDAGARAICQIISLDNCVLTEHAVHVTDAGFADLWRLVNLRSLSISAPNVRGAGLAALGELPRLDWLQLGGSGVEDVALRHAAASSSLERLFVGSQESGGPPKLTDAGLLHLAESRSLAQFEFIRRETRVTDEGVAELRARRPELDVRIR